MALEYEIKKEKRIPISKIKDSLHSFVGYWGGTDITHEDIERLKPEDVYPTLKDLEDSIREWDSEKAEKLLKILKDMDEVEGKVRIVKDD